MIILLILHKKEAMDVTKFPVGYLIKNISDKIKMHADADLKSHDLTLAQGRILGFLAERGGSAMQKEIEDFMEVSHPTVVGIVARMEQKGFLTCRTDESDKRNKIVTITEKSIRIGEDMDSMIGIQESRMVEGLSEDQITELTDALQVIYKNLL